MTNLAYMNAGTALNTANIFSIFASVQGEGIYVGVPQIFIRFTGCNIRCGYCDTAEALTPQAIARVEATPFSGNMTLLSNPLSIEVIAGHVKGMNDSFNGFHSIALTGGEPLVSNGFLKKLLPALKGTGLRIFLETNGTLPEKLEEMIEMVDIVSMDIKIPSSMQNGTIDWNKTKAFLEIASRKDCYVKIIIDDKIQEEELKKAGDLAASINPDMPVVIQPVSSGSNGKSGSCVSLKKLADAYGILRAVLSDVRIIPQVHKLAGWN
ncbi:MAG: 7-carboxy-7-deazaguanine synthase QueE [Planctomycetes bacterium]|nr:7-carboxy-7-deazaguanine synthase QueE [Planctomycetota bacterium]